jgi:hypothetical protein
MKRNRVGKVRTKVRGAAKLRKKRTTRKRENKQNRKMEKMRKGDLFHTNFEPEFVTRISADLS